MTGLLLVLAACIVLTVGGLLSATLIALRLDGAAGLLLLATLLADFVLFGLAARRGGAI